MNFFGLGLSRIRNIFINRSVVLMYHRIAKKEFDPWNLAVTSEHFNQHLDILSREFKVISTGTVAAQLKTKSIASNRIVITFDDGYRDNYFVAKPMLEQYQLPATFYIPSYYIGSDEQFWWDELTEIIFNSVQLPPLLRLDIRDEVINFELFDEVSLTDTHIQMHRKWKARDKPPTKRCELYLLLWKLIRPLPFSELKGIINTLKDWANYKSVVRHEYDLPMNRDHICQMTKNIDFDIGVHTTTHTALGQQTFEIQKEEISYNRNYLQKTFERPINTLSYPYGSYNENTIEIAKANNLTAAFTSKGRAITNRTDIFQIGRFVVKNWKGDEFRQNLKTWFKKYEN